MKAKQTETKYDIEDDLDDAYGAVREEKLRLLMAEGVRATDFVVDPRGGNWTKKHKLVKIDSYMAVPCSGLPTKFVNKFLPAGSRSFSCMISTHGEVLAFELPNLWTLVMQIWFEEWAGNGCRDDQVFSLQDARDLMADSVKNEFDTIPMTHESHHRLAEIRTLRLRRIL